MSELEELVRREGVQWKDALRASRSGQRVLVATSLGGFNHGTVTERVLAVALTLRGAAVDVFLCDGAPACQLTKVDQEPPEQVATVPHRARCQACVCAGRAMFGGLGLPVHELSALLTPADIDEAGRIAAGADIAAMGKLRFRDWAIGEHALAGALRYFARGSLEPEPLATPVARRFIDAAARTGQAIDRLLARGRYDVVVANHGIYTPQGVICEVARSRGVRVVNWNPAYRRHCFIFSHGDSYHHTMMSEDVALWEQLELTPAERARIEGYLQDRRTAKNDWIWFNKETPIATDNLRSALRLDARPVVVALTSVVWDAQLHYEAKAFPSQAAWLIQTIAYFQRRPDLQLVVRVHPAEVSGAVPSRDRMADIVRRYFAALPDNVRVVAPEDTTSTYSIVDEANAALVYSTKTGIEISALGIPVLVAGEAWIRNKGFTYDALSPEHYDSLLNQLPFAGRQPPELQERALRYAHHFFFRRMIELPFIVDRAKYAFGVELQRLGDLRPGRYVGLDCICDGVLKGSPFVQVAA